VEEFPETRQEVTFTVPVPLLVTPPPKVPPVEVLLEIVQEVMFKVPALKSTIPPPVLDCPLAIVRPEMVTLKLPAATENTRASAVPTAELRATVN
jgi:hypothetical protein